MWDIWHFNTRYVVYLKSSSVLLWIFNKIKIEILHGIYKRDIGYSSVDSQGYRILMTPHTHTHPSPPPPHTHTHDPQPPPSPHPIQASPFRMHAKNMRSLFCLWTTGRLSLSTRWSHASGREFLGYVLCVKSLVRPSHGVLGNKGSCSLPFREHWKIL